MSPGAALKRALITLLLALARQYELVLNINRDSPDQWLRLLFFEAPLSGDGTLQNPQGFWPKNQDCNHKCKRMHMESAAFVP